MKRNALVLVCVAVFSISGVQAQKIRTYTANPSDSMPCVEAYSLYSEFVKQENYNDAVVGWRKATSLCPKIHESLWINGIKIYSDFIEKTEDKALKDKYIDTLEWCYDQRIQYFGKEGYVLGRKGSDMLKYRPSNPQAAYDVLRKSLDMQKTESEPGPLIYLYKSAYELNKKGALDKQVLFELYDLCSEAVDANKSDAKLGKAYMTAQDNIDKMFSTVAECPDLIEIYQPKFNANPGDVAMLKRILKTMEKRDCTDAELYQNAAVALYKLEPSAEAAYAIANGYAKRDNYSGALEYYMEAVKQAQDNDMKAQALNKAANTALLLKQNQKAKQLALQILEMNPNDGSAYIIIGDSYLGSRGECAVGDDCHDRAVYWVAYDKYAKAKAVDASVAETANKRMATAKEQFPKKTDCFFYSLNEGDSYTLENCWIGETTTVRTREN